MKAMRLLPIAWAPFLGACMMGGVAHTSRVGGAGPGHMGETPDPMHYAEASGESVTIELSFPTPRRGGPVAMEARLSGADESDASTEGAVRLRVDTPGGYVDEVRMERFQSSDGPIYRATYDFRTPGSYLVTAQGSMMPGADARSASVTTRVDVEDAAYGDRHGWVMPMAILGGLGMIVMMVVMMTG